MLFSVFVIGCSLPGKQIRPGNVSSKEVEAETLEDVETALKSVAEAISGQEMTDEDLKRLSKQIQKEEEAKSAVNAVTEAMGDDLQKVKYCPLDGKRYSPKLETCPEHGVLLMWVEE